jgi:hypothetical protein
MVLKRTLTRKSILGFGNDSLKNLSVQAAIDLGKTRYLARSYFNLEKISFTDDILDELGITLEYRIEKPGTSEKKRTAYFENLVSKMTPEEKYNYQKVKKK